MVESSGTLATQAAKSSISSKRQQRQRQTSMKKRTYGAREKLKSYTLFACHGTSKIFQTGYARQRQNSKCCQNVVISCGYFEMKGNVINKE